MARFIAFLGLFIIVAGLAGLVYYQAYHLPKEREQNEKLWVAMLELDQNNFQDALYGTEEFYGLEAISHGYSWAKSTKLAKYLAGVASMKMKKYPETIEYLEGLSFDYDLLNVMTYTVLADAYTFEDQTNLAIDRYNKAFVLAYDKYPQFAYLPANKLAAAYIFQEKYKDALKIYDELLSLEETLSEHVDLLADIHARRAGVMTMLH